MLFIDESKFYIKCRLKAGNSCYYSVQTLLSSILLSKNLKFKINNTIILPVVLYGCETCSLTLKEECMLRVFENRILRRIIGTKKDEDGEWGMLHNKELHSLFRPHNIVRVSKSRRLKWAGHVARMEEGRSTFKILTYKTTGKDNLIGLVVSTSDYRSWGRGFDPQNFHKF